MRRFLAWILILHAFAHTFVGTWTSARAGAWPATFWTVATVGFLAAALGMLRLPLARRVWKLSFLAATAASMHLMVWYAPPFAFAGMVIDIALFIVVMGVYQPRIDADITVVETLGTGAFRHPIWMRSSWTIGFAVLAYVAVVLVCRPVTLHWGTTPAERNVALPGDEVHPATQRDYLDGRFGGLGWRVNVLDPPRVIGLENWGTFVLQPVDSTTTRLIVRTRGPGTVSVAACAIARASGVLQMTEEVSGVSPRKSRLPTTRHPTFSDGTRPG